MNRFHERQRKIIKLLSAEQGDLTGKALSLALHVSLRTVQSEISSINKELPLIQSSNRGYHLDRTRLHLLKPEASSPARPVTQMHHGILQKLLFTNTPYQIDAFAESLYMSTSSLERQIKGLSPLLSRYELHIERKNGCIRITGNELNKRRLINHLIIKETSPAFNSIDNLSEYFPDIDIEKINLIIMDSIKKYHYYLDDAYYNNILINVVIALCRMKDNNYVESDMAAEHDTDTIEYQIAKEICEKYFADTQIVPDKKDILSIAFVMEGLIRPMGKNLISARLIADLDEILLNIFNYYMLDIDYSKYLYNFALHIDGMLKRAHNSSPVENDILNTIKRNCPFIYDVSVFVAQRISEKFHVQIADTEIGYISIHLGFLIEDARKVTDKISVLLFCNDYHQIDETIEKNLRENFSKWITISLFHPNGTDTMLNTAADLIVTTRPLNIIGKKVVVISPFYTVIDHISIDNAIHECMEIKQKNHNKQLLSSFFNSNLFFRQDNFQNKEEVIRFLGQKVIDFGLADADFTESVLERERLSSTCFFDTFAIPHAMNMNAHGTMFCVLTSEKGIPWDHHMIHIVLMIVVQQSDRKKFMELYNGVVQTLEDQKKIRRLVQADNLMEFINGLIH